MISSSKQKASIIATLRLALKEDIGNGDITTAAIIPSNLKIKAQFVAKSNGIIAGLKVAKLVFEILDKNITFTALEKDGMPVKTGTKVAVVAGSAGQILQAERVALNLMQRMSGIATVTASYVNKVKKTKAIILDTRKTVPMLRIFDKWAIRLGGGQNHRFGLFDKILIKDNHIAAVGSITDAISLVRNKYKTTYPIEVEVNNLNQLREALVLKPDRILLDNMKLVDIQKAVSITDNKIPLEVSGNVDLSTVEDIAQTGVNFISVGALTHSVKAMDISLEVL